MNRLVRLALCVPLVLVAVGCGSPTTPASTKTADVAEVKAAFDTYVKAALGKDGVTARSVLASPIQDFYEKARGFALTGTDEQLRTLPPGQELTTYVLRAELSPDLLRGGSVDQILETAFNQGLVGEAGLSGLGLGDIAIEGDKAAAAITSQGKTAPFKLDFLREGGRWKVDIASLIPVTDDSFRGVATKQGISVEAMIDKVMVQKYGAEKAVALHQPVGA
jgi:hypothetical protein